jgi:hypothetical protein
VVFAIRGTAPPARGSYVAGSNPDMKNLQQFGRWVHRYPIKVSYEEAVVQAGVDQRIYGTKIIPLLKINTTTTTATISAGITFKGLITRPYCSAGFVSVQNCTISKGLR